MHGSIKLFLFLMGLSIGRDTNSLLCIFGIAFCFMYFFDLIGLAFALYYDGNNIQMENLTNETIFVLIKHIENLEFSDNIFLILRAYTMNNSGKINKILFDSFPYYSKYIIEKGEFIRCLYFDYRYYYELYCLSFIQDNEIS